MQVDDLEKQLTPIVKRADAKAHVVRQMIPRRHYR
jgi:hypothetical protein